jgi:hypothetical protein
MAGGVLLFGVIQLSGGIGVAADRLEGASGWLIATVVIVVLALVDLWLIASARRRFRRGWLIATS